MNKKDWNNKLKSLINIRRANELSIQRLIDNNEELDLFMDGIKDKITTFK